MSFLIFHAFYFIVICGFPYKNIFKIQILTMVLVWNVSGGFAVRFWSGQWSISFIKLCRSYNIVLGGHSVCDCEKWCKYIFIRIGFGIDSLEIL